MRYKQGFVLLSAVFLCMAAMSAAAQEATPTPLQIQLTTDTPMPAGGQEESGVATATWTPTDVGPVILQALDIANVRILPDTTETQVGVIRAGEFYPITGRYFDWLQLQFDASPNGFGWVYSELVDVVGDSASIPEVDPYNTGGDTGTGADATTGGDPLEGGVVTTATAQTDLSILPDNVTTATPAPALPTFTYPPGVIRPQATDPANAASQTNVVQSASSTSDVPPIMPIVIIGGIGLLGLALTSIRRG